MNLVEIILGEAILNRPSSLIRPHITTPRLSKNLISARKLNDEGYVVTFNDKNWKFSKGSLIVAKGMKVGTLYLCTGHTIPST